MKLKPWLPESRSGLSQWVQPSWCQATDPPKPGMLDPDRLVERDEVVAVDRRGHREQLRMAVHPQAGRGELERPEDELHDVLGRALGRRRLGHLHRMPPVRRARAADRVGQRSHPAEVPLSTVGTERGTPMAVERCTLGDGRPFEHLGHVALDVVELLLGQDPLEDVEAVTLVRVDDGLVARRPFSSKRIGPRLPSATARRSPSRR